VILEVEDLEVAYGGALVLQGLSLTVGEGESVGLLGRNGMGKTTLVRSICNLTPPQVTTGTIRFRGEEITGAASFRIARAGIGLVPQGRRVFGSLTVEENLRIVSTKASKDWTVERVYDFFPRLAERKGEFARSLSGGEQQMLAIGRALMLNPSLLIMDEPSEGLAPSVLDTMQERLGELRSTGLSILVAEQNLDLALALSDRIYILGNAGTTAWEGTPAELAADMETMTRMLGV